MENTAAEVQASVYMECFSLKGRKEKGFFLSCEEIRNWLIEPSFKIFLWKENRVDANDIRYFQQMDSFTFCTCLNALRHGTLLENKMEVVNDFK